MLQPKLLKVTPDNAFELLLEYETGEKKRFNVSPYISGDWFGELRNPAYFQMVRILPGGIGLEWPNGQDIAPHELNENSVNE